MSSASDSPAPSSDSSGSSPPPPSPDDSSSGSSPPPSSDDSSSSSPPPPSPDDSSSGSSPPPSSDDSSSSSPPPPSPDDSSPPPDDSPSPPLSSEDSPSPPPSSDDSPSPPPPKSDDSSPSPPGNSKGSDNGKESPPPPPKSGSSSGNSNPPPPPLSRPSRSSPDSAQKELPSSSSDQNNKALVAGLASGAALLFIIMIICCVCCCRRKKRRRNFNDMYYRENPHARATEDYYNIPHGNNWHNSNGRPSVDGMMKLPPPPGSGGVSGDHSWFVGPPPPSMMNSSEMHSAGFSGPLQAPLPPPHPAMAMGYGQSSFTYTDLAAATNGFSQANLLGQGGFGYVHKGVLPNGKEIAVKSLKSNSGQGEREFQAEVEIISRVHHRHLVSLVGYCIAGSQRMLVYEFVPNGTLEYHLHGAGRPTMDWPTRVKIALGAAKGFAYLHEDCHPRIIHRDIKTANILLDFQFEAKVADFGLAKLSSDTNTHVSTRIMGTFGYLAPEYASSGKLTEKSDVYSFGVVLLELITGRRPIDISREDDDDTLVDWARPMLTRVAEGGSYEELVDPLLGDNYDHQEMLRMVHCAAASIRQSARRRTKMSKLVRALEGDASLEDLNEVAKPGHGAVTGSSSSEYDVKVRRSELGLSSQEFSSEEHTSEFGSSQEIARSSANPSPNRTRPPL